MNDVMVKPLAHAVLEAMGLPLNAVCMMSPFDYLDVAERIGRGDEARAWMADEKAKELDRLRTFRQAVKDMVEGGPRLSSEDLYDALGKLLDGEP